MFLSQWFSLSINSLWVKAVASLTPRLTMKHIIQRRVFPLWTVICFLATCQYALHCFKELQGEDGHNFMCLWDVRCQAILMKRLPEHHPKLIGLFIYFFASGGLHQFAFQLNMSIKLCSSLKKIVCLVIHRQPLRLPGKCCFWEWLLAKYKFTKKWKLSFTHNHADKKCGVSSSTKHSCSSIAWQRSSKKKKRTTTGWDIDVKVCWSPNITQKLSA